MGFFTSNKKTSKALVSSTYKYALGYVAFYQLAAFLFFKYQGLFATGFNPTIIEAVAFPIFLWISLGRVFKNPQPFSPYEFSVTFIGIVIIASWLVNIALTGNWRLFGVGLLPILAVFILPMIFKKVHHI